MLYCGNYCGVFDGKWTEEPGTGLKGVLASSPSARLAHTCRGQCSLFE